MTKKIKQAKSEEKLTLDDLESGMKLLDSTRNPKEWQVDDDLIEQMRKYEQESNKSAIWKNKITGMFLFFKYYEDHPEEKLKTKKKPGRKPKAKPEVVEEEVVELTEEDLEAEIEADELEEIESDESEEMSEDELLDAKADYKAEHNLKCEAKDVDETTKKFKKFLEAWKKSE